MDQDLKGLLERVAQGALSVEDAAAQIRTSGFEDLGYAKVDHDRLRRQGVTEVIYGAGKTAQQITGIAAALSQHAPCVLITRLDAEKAQDVHHALQEKGLAFSYDEIPGVGVVGAMPPATGNGSIVVACAGTSDLPVAEEAACVARALGNEVVRLFDVGVSGLHRLLSSVDVLQSAQVIIAVAGMEGALPTVIAGLTSAPVIAVPTSVGYGASFGGVAALLGMLNSCGSGVSVVNIDNGFGAAFQAHQINHLGARSMTAPEDAPAENDEDHGEDHHACPGASGTLRDTNTVDEQRQQHEQHRRATNG